MLSVLLDDVGDSSDEVDVSDEEVGSDSVGVGDGVFSVESVSEVVVALVGAGPGVEGMMYELNTG